ncbi:MAG TPA: DUF805 domain-containing protein [Devosiaceae bacterium]|jgi:uncharacterized membrane protein YhaH (DUF805 family)|nr:DUF805 domain-containing protein [Devosiaceae bacterium]
MRGEILSFDGREGLIAGADGARYRFTATQFRNAIPEAGMAVDFVAEGNEARDIYPLLGTASYGAAAKAAIAAVAAAHAGAPLPQGARPPVIPLATPPRDRGLFGYFMFAATDNYANFSGRARRKEFWSFQLWYLLLVFLFMAITGLGLWLSNFNSLETLSVSPLLFIGTGLFVMFALGMIVPSLAVHVRRLHDIGLSGWWLLLHFVAGIGTIMLFIMSLVGGEPGPNRYGPAPK